MKYLFILGRNPELSIEEIKSHFEHSNLIKDLWFAKNGMIADFEKDLPEKIIASLGGTIAIGEVLASGSLAEIKKQIEKNEIYFGARSNFSYAVWNFSDENFYDSVSSCIKERFKSEGLKSSRKNPNGVLTLQSGEKINIPASLVEAEYFVFSSRGENFFGRIIEKTNYNEIEERDMNKPMRRQKLAISPRLAKILINLSGVRENQTLVDPFCGIGVILQEALIQKIKVLGIDKDADAIEGTRQNLKWGKFTERDFTLVQSDSSKIQIKNSNVLVTEPELGSVLTRSPNEKIAKEILSRYENLAIKVLNNLKNKISGRIVLTAPYIKMMGQKRKGCDIRKILATTKLKLISGFPIAEFRDRQIVGREIFVLEK